MYLIAKLLLNSLFGKMALSPLIKEYVFMTKDEFTKSMENEKKKIK